MNEELVTLTTYANLQDAYIVKGMLEEHGIPAAVSDENNLYVPVFNGAKLMVRASDAERARQLLNEFND